MFYLKLSIYHSDIKKKNYVSDSFGDARKGVRLLGSEIHANGDLKSFDIVPQEAIGVVVFGIQRHAVAQA